MTSSIILKLYASVSQRILHYHLYFGLFQKLNLLPPSLPIFSSKNVGRIYS
jgi:hypothetical protein